MCGIAGWYRSGDNKITESELKSLIIGLQVRGKDATGVAWKSQGYVYTLKSASKASDFINLPEFKKAIPEILDSTWVLLHTRFATHGSPKNYKNNHPVMNKKGLIIHNGIVTPKQPLDADGETDSEQLLLHIQKYGWHGISMLFGSAAFAYVNFSKPGFYLYTDKLSSLSWTYDLERQMFLFCSTKRILTKAYDVGSVFGMPKVVINDVPRATVYHINDGVKKIKEVKLGDRVYDYPQYSGYSIQPPQNIAGFY